MRIVNKLVAIRDLQRPEAHTWAYKMKTNFQMSWNGRIKTFF